MINKLIKIYFTINILAIIFCGALIYPLVSDYFEFQKAVEAAGGFPYQDGGIISAYQPACVITAAAGKCSCLYCEAACVSHDMIIFNGQKRGPSAFLCIPTVFPYQGGGTVPRPGAQLVIGGISNLSTMVKVVGISR